jgi:hypothetical protein
MKLTDIPKKDCFKTPENYFENLDKQIFQKLDSPNKVEKTSLFQLVKPYLYLAAGMVFLIMIIRVGLEVGLKDYNSTDIISKSISQESYFNELFDQMIYDDSFMSDIIYDEDFSAVESELNDIDYEYLEDYLAQYNEYELELNFEN